MATDVDGRESWLDQSACLNKDINKWFDKQGLEGQRICNEECEVRLKCLAWILSLEAGDGHKHHGVFGGLGPTERDRLNKKLKEMRNQNGISNGTA